ncbi:uncharacterized protein NEMAJ01_1797 [Nematocida major]|uniref:uncharacterized protein n=1 Tax=Nematocida major TaxID=1912982 RepID=UPI002007D607|nr:uncharacterized protein NEMAJ01_1797 [Nematocida major]KAH9386901.1 hypothetical protein NEMAJ01_1797 [Nematocida major]
MSFYNNQSQQGLNYNASQNSGNNSQNTGQFGMNPNSQNNNMQQQSTMLVPVPSMGNAQNNAGGMQSGSTFGSSLGSMQNSLGSARGSSGFSSGGLGSGYGSAQNGPSMFGGSGSSQFGLSGSPQGTASGLGNTSNPSMFGANSSQSAAGSAFGGFNSGQPAGQSSGIGSFGQNNNSTFGQNNNNSFGQNNNSFGQSNNNTLGQTSAFGQSNNNAFGQGSTFGQSNNNAFGQGSTLGQSNNNAFGQGSGIGSFGQNNSLLGQTSAFGQSNSAFGQGSTLGQTGSTFGQGSGMSAFGQNNSLLGQTSAFGQSNNTFNGANQSMTAGSISSSNIINSSLRNATGSTDDVLCTIDYLEKAYDRTSPLYKFTYIFYNLMDPSSPPPQRPSNVLAEMWDQAVNMNPAPQFLYPEIVFGYEDLSVRLEKQKTVIEKLKASRKYMGDRLNELVEGGILRLTNKLNRINEKYSALLVEVLEHAGKSLGPEIKSTSSQYTQLEKRCNLLSDGLASLAENCLAYRRQFDLSKTDQAISILEEQNNILNNMLVSVGKKLAE